MTDFNKATVQDAREAIKEIMDDLSDAKTADHLWRFNEVLNVLGAAEAEAPEPDGEDGTDE